ncbi:hypothetical protein FQN50_005598 [Emmonsiellopsis sp. PD_5]|nr:hypothetical protein FQN50_005598 [Emmonsiellopsis sp. PD_5]
MARRNRRLLRGETTYSSVKDEEVNILHRLEYIEQQDKFFAALSRKQSWMKAVVAHHLGLQSPDSCSMASQEDWIHGSFNVCIPVTVSSGWQGKTQTGQRLMLRFPLPYRVGDAFRPGNSDEKLRCEAGTYAWFQQNAADVPIPQLYGFALSTGEAVRIIDLYSQFTVLNCLPFWKRSFFKLRCFALSCLGRPLPSSFLRHQYSCMAESGVIDAGYLLIEYIEESTGQMLSKTWREKRSDGRLRMNFFRSLSRILLSITRTKLPRIGSFLIDNGGYLQLGNRPLSVEIPDLENEQIPTDIPRDYTYSAVESYVMDILRFHDNRILHQPNAVNDVVDYASQVAALAIMRAALPSFSNSSLRRGPFVMSLTDFNQSNIIVDERWNITCLLDLEWICSQPIEMSQVPIWLTCQAVDEIARKPEEYGQVRQELVEILAEEEKLLSGTPLQEQDGQHRLSAIMKQGWANGTFWYSLALGSPTGLHAIFYKQIKPRFLKNCPKHDEFLNVVPWYWRPDFFEVGLQKIKDKSTYDNKLREAFEEVPEASNQKNT